MIFSQKYHYRNKLILFFVLSAAFIVFVGTYRNIYYMNKYANEEFIQKVTLTAEEKNLFFKNLITNLKNSTLAISKDRLLISAIIKNDFLKPKAVFETFMNANKDFMQIRYLDRHGNELICIQRDSIAAPSYFVPHLQNKSHRYYFKNNISLQKGEVRFSDIDLNIEHGQIEKPIKPVLRSISAVFIRDRFRGLVIINYFMEAFLKQLTSSSLFYIYLVSQDGAFLIHRHPSYNWSKYLNKTYKIEHEFPSFYQKIVDGTLNIEPKHKLFVKDLTLMPQQTIKMIFTQNEEALNKNKLASKQLGFFIGLVGIIFSIPLGFLLSRPFNTMHEVLEELNKTLEKRISKSIEENRQNEQILMQQSKLAAMGEMIGNIAHQWRQPLTRLSLIIQNIAIAYESHKLDDTFMKKSEKNALNQIGFMSDTIDDFRDFFTPDRDKEVFFIAEIIKEAISLQSATIKHHNILLKLEFDHSLQALGYKNEFAQVILNLINNAKDAFVEREIEHRKLQIKLSHEKETIQIDMIDNAGGIKEEDIHKIFDPYFTTKFKSMGTGIGLYMSKIIIEKHMHGTIDVKNVEDGVDFMITFPLM